MSLKGHLTAGEIVEQLVHAMRVAPVRNIVFMVREAFNGHWAASCLGLACTTVILLV
jgi:hypothetical protein